MAEKRKVKRRKDEDFDFDNKDAKKPTKEEETVAKWMKKNVAVKKTKFAGHNVEYFTGSKAVDALMESDWCRKKVDKEPFFATRQDIVNFLNNMLRHKLFHRAKKVPVSEQELKKKMKKKDKKGNEKEDKKKKEDETPESSHAEGKEAEDKKQNAEDKQKCKKIKLQMHYEQMFVDNLDAYVWLYDPTPFYYWIIGFLVVIGAIAICLFPLWPPTVRMGVQYLSMAAAGLLILILALAVIRLIVFCLVWLLTCGTLHLWLLPNLTEDVGFFASFWPLYEYKYGNKKEGGKNKKNKKKKAKNSDNEEDVDNENNVKSSEVKDAVNDEKNTYKSVDNDSDNGSHSEGEANEETEYLHQNEEGGRQVSEDEDYDHDGESDEEDEESNDSEDSESYNQTDPAARNPSKSKSHKERGVKNKSSSGTRISRNDSEETDTESSSQHSLTGKDFEFVDREDSDIKS